MEIDKSPSPPIPAMYGVYKSGVGMVDIRDVGDKSKVASGSGVRIKKEEEGDGKVRIKKEEVDTKMSDTGSREKENYSVKVKKELF